MDLPDCIEEESGCWCDPDPDVADVFLLRVTRSRALELGGQVVA